MSDVTPTVSWKVLQNRKLQDMSETVPHHKDVAGMSILIHTNVYPPGTDTHLLAKTVRVKKGDKALDLCTGTGVIALQMARLGASRVVGVDLNPRAVENAKENKKIMGVERVEFRLGNMFEGITETFDVITINPPYTDRVATNDVDICFYDEGHKFLKSFFAGLRDRLNPEGVAYIAWSNISSMDILPALADEHNFELTEVSRDIGGRGYTFYVYSLTDKAPLKP